MIMDRNGAANRLMLPVRARLQKLNGWALCLQVSLRFTEPGGPLDRLCEHSTTRCVRGVPPVPDVVHCRPVLGDPGWNQHGAADMLQTTPSPAWRVHNRDTLRTQVNPECSRCRPNGSQGRRRASRGRHGGCGRGARDWCCNGPGLGGHGRTRIIVDYQTPAFHPCKCVVD